MPGRRSRPPGPPGVYQQRASAVAAAADVTERLLSEGRSGYDACRCDPMHAHGEPRPIMPSPAPEDFWKLVAASRLVAEDVVAGLRRDHERDAAGQPRPASDDTASAAIATWLVQRKILTKWQARRLLHGDSGPFFIGDYRLMERLESDGPGRLFRARHEPSGRLVCVLLLDRKLCQRVDVWTEVVRRTTIAHDAVDPTLSRTWSLEQVQGNRFIVCEDVKGVSLADELARLGPLPPADACRLMLAIVSAVAELHRRGAVHGGLSLDSVRREPAGPGAGERAGRVRLLQVPLAGDPHAVPAQVPIDATERIAGMGMRASFVAPELLLPGRFCDERSDVYALGCMLHALLTGVPPCWQGDAQSTLSQAAFVGPPPLGPPQVPVEVATLVSYLVARDPGSRYPDAAEAADALAGCMGLPPVSGALPPSQKPSIASGAAVSPTSFVAHEGGPPAVSVRTSLPAVSTGGNPASAMDTATAAARKRAARLGLIGLGIAGGIMSLSAAIVISRTMSTTDRPEQRTEVSTDDAGGEEGSDGATEPRPRRPAPSDATIDGPRRDPTTLQRSDAMPGTDMGAQVVDSVHLPWSSPTNGRPPRLSYLPPGSQLILLARPAEIAADEEGSRFVESLGPRVARGIATLQTLCGCGLEGLTEIQAGWQAGGGEPGIDTAGVVAGWTIRFSAASPLFDDDDARRKAWGETTEQDVDGERVYRGKTIAFWLPDAEKGGVLVVAPFPVVEAMVAAAHADGAEPEGDLLAASLPQDLEELVGMLDHTRHLTLLGSPQYLQTDGRPLLSGPLERLIEPLGSFFGEGVKAAAVSVHFGPNFYAEVDTIATRAEPAHPLAVRLARQFGTVAGMVEDFCVALDPHPYGRKLVMRLPAMLRVVDANVRCGAEGKGVVLNVYLPRHAGHNLVLASELAIEQSPGSGAVAGAAKTSSSVTAAGPQAGLQKKISLAFVNDNLERSLQMLSEEIGIPMQILGGDLQLDGITKNQSFGLEERDKPAEAVLRTILAKADSAGRLVYVVRKKDGGESIEITTKSAAVKRGDTLPAGY